MRKATKISLLIITCALCAATATLCAVFLSGWGVIFKIAFYGLSAVGLIAAVLFFALRKEALFKTCFLLVCVLAFFAAVFVALSEAGNLGSLASDEQRIAVLTDMIRSAGEWGMAVYVFIQILQVLVLPLPAAVCYMPGTLLFGAGWATLLASVGVIIGSFIAYWLGRLVGRRLVVWIAGEETTDKYAGYIAKKGKVIFVLMQILPFFPDDVLCLVAGMTAMSFPFFAAVMILVRPCIVAVYCFAVDLIPFSGWGIGVWAAILALCVVLAVLALKYQDRFEAWLLKLVRRRKKSPEVQPSTQPEATELSQPQPDDTSENATPAELPEGTPDDAPEDTPDGDNKDVNP